MMDHLKDQQSIDAYLRKAKESLESAESDYANRRYNSCANRCCYACFQAAIAALLGAGIRPRVPTGRWGHDYVQATFSGQMINRRKLLPGRYGDWLNRQRDLREMADYEPKTITLKEADRALRRSREFVSAIQRQGESI